MIKTISIAVLLLLVMTGIASAPEPIYDVITLNVRITACNYRSRVNHLGQRLPRDKRICAVERGKLPQGSTVYIPAIDKSFRVFDRMHQPSVNLHKRLARKRGIHIDTVIDLYWNVPAKQLNKKDLGYKKIKVYIRR